MELLLSEYYVLVVAFLFSAGLITILNKPAHILGWVDMPGVRKHHVQPVPLVGGVAMCIAFCLSVLLLPEKPNTHFALLGSITLLTLTGFYDDIHHIKPTIRFLFQIAAVMLTVLAGDTVLSNLGNLFGWGNITFGWLAIPFTLFSAVGVINAFNMIDGLDGLAGGLALITTGWLIVLCLMATTPKLPVIDISILLILMMVIAGFLVFNLRHLWRAHACVFMGDAGSTMLGFLLSWFVIRLSQGETAVMAPMTAVWILALPLMDTVAVMIRRICANQNPLIADRQHLHHLLLSFGISDGRVTALLLASATITGAIGVFAWFFQIPEYLQFYSFLLMFLIYYFTTNHIWLQRNKSHTPINSHD